MKTLVAACIFLIFTAVGYSLCYAGDYEDGISAYSRGDYLTSFTLLLKEAQLGNADAQYKIGFMYANGQGTQANDSEALRWYRLAAEAGLTAAQYNLGIMYEDGKGVLADNKEAFKWYSLAAEKGLAVPSIILQSCTAMGMESRKTTARLPYGSTARHYKDWRLPSIASG